VSAFVDTNILIRHLTGDPPDTAARATAYLGSDDELLLTDLVAAETVYVLESFYEAPRHQVAEAVRSLIAFDSVVCVDPALLLWAAEVYETDRIDFADAYLVACAESTDVGRIASFDRSLDRSAASKGLNRPRFELLAVTYSRRFVALRFAAPPIVLGHRRRPAAGTRRRNLRTARAGIANLGCFHVHNRFWADAPEVPPFREQCRPTMRDGVVSNWEVQASVAVVGRWFGDGVAVVAAGRRCMEQGARPRHRTEGRSRRIDQASMAARSAARRWRSIEYHTHLPRRSPWTRPASLRILRWCETVGWLFPTGATKSHTHTSPMGAAARMLSTRRRTGSAKAKNPVASWAASTASRGAARTDEQHYSLSATTIARLRAAMLHGLLLTIVNVSTMINASTVLNTTGG
jgi:predicted nucleic acid-binding protein